MTQTNDIAAKTLNLEAFELRTKLFNLIGEFKALAHRAHLHGGNGHNAHDQIDPVACNLAGIYEGLASTASGECGSVFTDVLQDDGEMNFGFSV